MDENSTKMDLTAQIVAAYVGNNSVRPADLADLIGSVHDAIKSLGHAKEAPEPVPAKPAVPVKKSITHDYLICLDDGRKFRSLKRHLRYLGMSPDDYRTKWGLPPDYPMVAPGYAEKRSQLARQIGLGSMRKKGAPTAGPKRSSKRPVA